MLCDVYACAHTSLRTDHSPVWVGEQEKVSLTGQMQALLKRMKLECLPVADRELLLPIKSSLIRCVGVPSFACTSVSVNSSKRCFFLLARLLVFCLCCAQHFGDGQWCAYPVRWAVPRATGPNHACGRVHVCGKLWLENWRQFGDDSE